ncbi:MAG: URC4/urg3 family protein [Legionella sp.]
MNNEHARVLEHLNNPVTIREQSHRILTMAKKNQLQHFSLNPEQMLPTAQFIIEVIQQKYPDLNVPYHSRWRHFEADGIDRIATLMAPLQHLSVTEKGKILYEIAIISVLLDAGAGASWSFNEALSGKSYSRSEGLALASLQLYLQGSFSADAQSPLRVDAERLIHFNEQTLATGFQVSEQNPLEGITGRVALLNSLGAAIKNNQAYFGTEGRLGDFFSYANSLAEHNKLAASQLFSAVLAAFNSIWPARLSYKGTALGDVWQHRALKTAEPASDYIPFHKLSQWLTYSLMEPLEQAGVELYALDNLTGLPEYRNGGLLIDTGLLQVKNEELLRKPQEAGCEAIVEWRALTVALLDELAALIRTQLQLNAQQLPLAKILQGGTWEAGRQIARTKRHDGTPPIQIISDGTVF